MTATETTPELVQSLAPIGAPIEVDAATNRIYTVDHLGNEWWAQLVETVNP